MDAENLELNELHTELGDQIFTVDSLKLEKRLKEEIKYSLFNAAEIVSEVIESMEGANTLKEGIE